MLKNDSQKNKFGHTLLIKGNNVKLQIHEHITKFKIKIKPQIYIMYQINNIYQITMFPTIFHNNKLLVESHFSFSYHQPNPTN